MTPTLSRIIQHPASPAAALFLILAVTRLCYRPGLGGPFLLDDAVNIPQVELPQLNLTAIGEKILYDPRASPFFRTVGRLSFALTIHYSGLDASAFKYQNLMLHLINGLLVFWLISLLAAEQEKERFEGRRRAYWFALVVTAIWLLHPLQVSTVLYAVQRLTLLSALFVLLALVSYVKGRILSRTRPGAGAALAAGGILLFGTLGLASKENAALLPLFVVAIELFVFRLSFANGTRKRLLVLLLGAAVALPVIAALTYGAALIPAFVQSYAGRDFDLVERLMTQAHVLMMYLRLFFIPIPGEMSLFHDDFPVTRALDGATVGLALLYAALIAGAFFLRRRLPLTGLGVLWFFIAHLMESTILPLELVFEHRNYLALLGLALALVDLLRYLAQTPMLRGALTAGLAGLLLMIGLNTAARAFAWSDLPLLLATEYERRPGSSRVVGYLAEINMANGRTEHAKRFVEELLAIGRPDAGAEIMNIHVRCSETRISQDIFERARNKLATGTMSAFTFESLNRLTQNYVQGECPALTFPQADALLRAATPNPRGPVGTRCLIAYVRAKLLISEGQWDDVPDALSGTIARCAAKSDALLGFIVGDWVRFALDIGGSDRVLAVLNALSREQSLQIANMIGETSFEFPKDPR
jgi:hypothetical protein